jgi:Ni,Fe-hydrogenase I small subunit
VAGREQLTVLCVEGSIALAEDGMFDIAGDAGKFHLVRSLCERADYEAYSRPGEVVSGPGVSQ